MGMLRGGVPHVNSNGGSFARRIIADRKMPIAIAAITVGSVYRFWSGEIVFATARAQKPLAEASLQMLETLRLQRSPLCCPETDVYGQMRDLIVACPTDGRIVISTQ